MPYIIDGHNLIPKIPGLSLEDPDDEVKLVELLTEFCQKTGKRIQVFFDRAPTGHSRVRNFGSVVARFARSGQTADDAIYRYLQNLEGAAHNWTVISSDRMVKNGARHSRARVIDSEEFARTLLDTLYGETTPASDDVNLSADEVDEWLGLFGDAEGNA
ncbi:MAG: NYN domain-containing protein [Anaerolineales bacterium]|nr:NYN domain-containing protein [Anaerolineales bacterium]